MRLGNITAKVKNIVSFKDYNGTTRVFAVAEVYATSPAFGSKHVHFRLVRSIHEKINSLFFAEQSETWFHSVLQIAAKVGKNQNMFTRNMFHYISRNKRF